MFTKVQRDCDRRRAISAPMKESIDYLRRRERQERAAAKRASGLSAQRARQNSPISTPRGSSARGRAPTG